MAGAGVLGVTGIAAVAGTAAAYTWPILLNGDSGNRVAAVQVLLYHRGYSLNDYDGIYGPETERTVTAFQRDTGLSGVDGIVGPETWGALISTVSRGHGSSSNPNYAVFAAQGMLSVEHGYDIAIDGIFGPGTESAVRSFQSSRNLTVDGIVGPQTWRALVAT